MNKLYKISASDWEIQFDSDEVYKFPFVVESKIIYRRNLKSINITVGNYCDELLIEKIQTENIKYLKEFFDVVDEKSNIVESPERTYENIVLVDITNHSKSDGIDTYVFRFYQDSN